MPQTLIDGLQSLDRADLTECAAWCVEFDHIHRYNPVVVVPFDTNLDTIEAVARHALLEELTKTSGQGTRTYSSYLNEVSTVRVLSVKRYQNVYLDPTLG